MKTLYCIIGNLRGGDLPVESFIEHLKDDETDVALYVGDTYPESKWRDIAKYIWETDETKNWWEDEYDKKINDWRDWHHKTNIFGPYGVAGSGMIICAYREKLLKKIETIKKYDRYVLARSDQVYVTNELPTVLKNEIYIPSGCAYCGVTDRFSVADYDSFCKSLNVLDTLKKIGETYPDNVERLLKKHYENQNLDIVSTKRYMYSVARLDEQTRWKGVDDKCPKVNGEYYAKYPGEYQIIFKRIKRGEIFNLY
jgi:hypothetical protein